MTVPGTPITLTLGNALPGGSATLVVGASRIDAGFKGGVLVPAPDLLVAGLPVGPGGELVLGSTWPPGVPLQAKLYLQFWIVDAGGPKGLAASNALQAMRP